MYCQFFGFTEKPFDVTPDPKFLYLSPGHREILATLIYGIRERRGFITIVGEVGTGKTTLLNTVLGQLDGKTYVASIFNTDVTFDEMLTWILVDLGLAKSEETVTKVQALFRLREFAIRQLSTGGNVVILVDEAQHLDRSVMENLRLLSNLETRKHKLIQIVLAGQPELDVKLSQPELRQLAQRINLRRYITPLGEKEAYEYIQHRLSLADYNGPQLFSRQARKIIWEYSGGVPRKINVVCDNALLIAYGLRQKRIEASVIEEAIKDLSWSPFSGSRDVQEQTPVEPAPRSQEKTFRSRFATAATLVLTTPFILLVAFPLVTVLPNLKGGGLLSGQNSIKIPTQLAHRDQSPAPRDQPLSREPSPITLEGAVSASLQEKPESAHATILELPYGPQGLDDTWEGLGDQQPLENPEPSLNEIGKSPGTENQVVVVKRGDNLIRIIFHAYGRYDGAMLRAVLRENPEIQNANRLMPGQVIKLPKET